VSPEILSWTTPRVCAEATGPLPKPIAPFGLTWSAPCIPPGRDDGHPSGTDVAASLVRSTCEHRAGGPLALRPRSGWGLPSRPGYPGRWWSLTPPFHPYPRWGPVCFLLHLPAGHRGPTLPATALWSPDFPQRRSAAAVRPAQRGRRGSNPRPRRWQRRALPAAPRPHVASLSRCWPTGTRPVWRWKRPGSPAPGVVGPLAAPDRLGARPCLESIQCAVQRTGRHSLRSEYVLAPPSLIPA
jgi:hypothetical protein